MAQLYDLMMLLDPGVDDERRHEILADVRELVDEGGALVEAHDWGPLRTAYSIRSQPEADFQLLRFEGDGDLLEKLNGSLRITDGVLRFRVIRKRTGDPPVPEPPEPIRPGGRQEGEGEGRVAARAAADASLDAEDDEDESAADEPDAEE